MKLYGYWRSSCSWRVRIALAFKEIEIEHHPIHLVLNGGEQFQQDYTAQNPMAQVPSLELDDGRILTQSMAILEYLEERFPTPSLLPSDPYLRAKVRQLSEVINSGIQPLQNLSLLNKITQQWNGDKILHGRSVIESGLLAVEELAQSTAGKYLVGDHPSFAECCVIPQLYNARRFKCSFENLPLLLRVEELCEQQPCFQRAHPSTQPDAIR